MASMVRICSLMDLWLWTWLCCLQIWIFLMHILVLIPFNFACHYFLYRFFLFDSRRNQPKLSVYLSLLDFSRLMNLLWYIRCATYFDRISSFWKSSHQIVFFCLSMSFFMDFLDVKGSVCLSKMILIKMKSCELHPMRSPWLLWYSLTKISLDSIQKVHESFLWIFIVLLLVATAFYLLLVKLRKD